MIPDFSLGGSSSLRECWWSLFGLAENNTETTNCGASLGVKKTLFLKGFFAQPFSMLCEPYR